MQFVITRVALLRRSSQPEIQSSFTTESRSELWCSRPPLNWFPYRIDAIVGYRGDLRSFELDVRRYSVTSPAYPKELIKKIAAVLEVIYEDSQHRESVILNFGDRSETRSSIGICHSAHSISRLTSRMSRWDHGYLSQ